MANAIVGTWVGTWTLPAASTSTTFPATLKIARMPLAHTQCGLRELSAGNTGPGRSPLCVDSSRMGISGTLHVDDPNASPTFLTGEFSVVGANLTQGQVFISSENSHLRLIAEWTGGQWESCRAEHFSGSTAIATCTLDMRK